MIYAKAITAFLTGLVGVLAMFVPSIQGIATPEVIAAVTTIITTLLVFIVPNKQA